MAVVRCSLPSCLAQRERRDGPRTTPPTHDDRLNPTPSGSSNGPTRCREADDRSAHVIFVITVVTLNMSYASTYAEKAALYARRGRLDPRSATRQDAPAVAASPVGSLSCTQTLRPELRVVFDADGIDIAA